MEQAYQREQFEDAKSLAQEVLAKLPTNLNALRGYALSCLFLEQYEEALDYLLRCLEVSKEQEFEYTYIGWCFCNMDNHIKACEAFEKAVETAYKAVMKPTEGTILTVMRVGAETVAEKIDEVKAYVVGDELKEITLRLGALTDHEREIIAKGCLINYNKK